LYDVEVFRSGDGGGDVDRRGDGSGGGSGDGSANGSENAGVREVRLGIAVLLIVP
jgi:hypothetical protein